MPTIRIEDDVFQGLKSIAEPFIDNPNTVVRRLLVERVVLPKPQESGTNTNTGDTALPSQHELKGGARTTDPQHSPTPSLTPQPVYENFLLYVLHHEFKDRATTKGDATRAVIELMKTRGFIGAQDLERVQTGETKAENTIAWGRNALKDRGLISRISQRGSWELTPEGVVKAKRVILPRQSS